MNALELTPEQHLTKACEALDANHDAKTAEDTAALCGYATAHLLAAQAKLKLSEDPYGDPRPWDKS